MNAETVPVIVAGLGAATAVGMNAPSSAAAVRAGISGITDHPFLFDVVGDPFRVTQAGYLDIDLCGADRLGELARRAASEALEHIAKAEASILPIFIGLPSARPGRPQEAAEVVSEEVHNQVTQAGLQPGDVQIIETGHSAGTMAIQAAWELVRSGGADLSLCGGVESYREPQTMAWLEANGQVHGAADNSWGFTPGEAAGFVVLAAAGTADRINSAATLELLTAVTTRETKLIKTDTVCTGEGLTALFRAFGVALPPGSQVDSLDCDMNGEPYRADEFGFAIARTAELFRSPLDFHTPATSWGDVGAASGPLLLVLADASVRRGYSPGPLIATFTSAESGERSGFVVRALSNRR